MARNLTPDVIRTALKARPWLAQWEGSSSQFGVSPRILSAGHYYTNYFVGAKKNDLTDLYMAYRGGDEDAFGQVVDLLREPIHRWVDAGREDTALIVPMIGTAPNERLARKYSYPVLFPWKPRPENYGNGVEGKTSSQKWDSVSEVLKLVQGQKGNIAGKSVLLLDDNITDGITYLVARNLLLKAGAKEVGLVTLTNTIREEIDHRSENLMRIAV